LPFGGAFGEAELLPVAKVDFLLVDGSRAGQP
jgi:hypothetical protein